MRAIMTVILMIVLLVASATAGIRHYCDYLGSIRVIVNTDGEVEQTVDYLSTGIPIIGGKGEIIDDRLHIGKQYLSLNGSLLYDNIVYSAEKFACNIENYIRREHNIPLRTHYLRYSNVRPLNRSSVLDNNTAWEFYAPIFTILPF